MSTSSCSHFHASMSPSFTSSDSIHSYNSMPLSSPQFPYSISSSCLSPAHLSMPSNSLSRQLLPSTWTTGTSTVHFIVPLTFSIALISSIIARSKNKIFKPNSLLLSLDTLHPPILLLKLCPSSKV